MADVNWKLAEKLLPGSSSGVRSTSTMVAIYPPEEFLDLAARHAHPDMIEEGLHVTVFYVGDTTPEDDEGMKKALERACEKFPGPIEMYSNGPGCFYNSGKFVRLLLMNGVGLDILRAQVLQEMFKEGYLGPQRHGFCGHLTLEYHDDTELPEEWESCALEEYPRFPVDRLYLVRANEVLAEIPLGK